MSCDAELGIVLKWVFIGFRICKNSIYSHREIGIYDSVYCNQPHRHLWQIWNKANLLQASPMVLNVKHFLYPKSAWCCLSSLPTLDNNLLLKPTHCTCLNNMILDTDWIMHLSVSAIYLLIWWVKFFTTGTFWGHVTCENGSNPYCSDYRPKESVLTFRSPNRMNRLLLVS